MKKRKVKRYEIGGDVEDNYARNENREGRESTLDPSDREDAERGRRMTGTFGQVEYPNRLREAAEAAGTAGEDTGVGLLSGATRPVKPAVRPSVRPAVKPPVTPPVRPVSGGGRGTMAGPTAEQIEEGRKKFAEDQGRRNLERLQKEDKPLERVNPEANLMGGPALRGAKAMATGLREAADFVKQRMARGPASGFREAPAGLLERSRNVSENLTKDMGPVQYAGKRSMLQNQRGEGVITPPAAPFAERNKRMLMQNQRGEGVITPPAPVRPPRGGGKDPGARKPTRDELDEMRIGSDYMRKGGRVKAYKSGGSVSSASKRADGIAMRGKTRGKYI